MGRAIHIDYFGVGLEDMPRKDQANDEKVLAVLREAKRFSAFEASANNVIAATITRLCKTRLTTDISCGYPWTEVIAIDGKPI
jgi:hypothetical protein|tara:strand:- start:2496 stop:2744 length:249 start_codon:yes stop_codon:yes gene_type:complete